MAVELEDLHAEVTINNNIVPYFDIQISSSCCNVYDVATVRIDNAFGNFTDGITKTDEITIKAGYKDVGLWTAYKGFVTEIKGGKYLKISAKDQIWELDSQAIFKQSFSNENPVGIVNWILRKLNISVDATRLPADNRYPSKKHLWLINDNLTSAAQRIRNAWNIQGNLFARDGVIYFDTEPDDKDLFDVEFRTLIENDTLFRLKWDGENGSARIRPPLFQIRHSDTIIIKAVEIPEAEYKIVRLQHNIAHTPDKDNKLDTTPHTVIEFIKA